MDGLKEANSASNSTSLIQNKTIKWKHNFSYFNDGVRIVDYVLAWDASSGDGSALEKRVIFEENLTAEGLELERDASESSKLTFVKVHVTQDALLRYAEILKFRVPVKKGLQELKLKGKKRKKLSPAQEAQIEAVEKKGVEVISKFKNIWLKSIYSNVHYDEVSFPKHNFKMSTVFSRDKWYLFDVEEENFFSITVRARVCNFILERAWFAKSDGGDEYAFGINRLISMKVYKAAYPLHDGSYKTEGTLRHALLKEWGALNKWYKYQPLDYIKDYFGVKIAMYFCWLGFYTLMLLPAGLIGLIVFICGFFEIHSSVGREICDSVDVPMCPLCDGVCSVWELSTICSYTSLMSFVDNPGSVAFAMFMSVWAAVFLELWKRYSAEITHRWDTASYDTFEEAPRPQYLAKTQRYNATEKNVVTGMEEKRIPFWSVRMPAAVFSFSVVGFLVLIAFVACVGVIVYRTAMITVTAVHGASALGHLSTHVLLIINISGGLINLATLISLTKLYDFLAVSLTERELNRTQSQFEDSLTFKMYLLQFVNYYTAIFYLAFYKGKFVGYPGKYVRIFNVRQEDCNPSGCLFEVTVQLAIIMVGKQIFRLIFETVYPMLMKYWRRGFKGGSWKKKADETSPQWVQDYYLNTINIFPEYLEMVLQFGFITVFVAAFPLAPLCALINNIFETRTDARKMLKYYRRPVAIRVKDIGVWLTILKFVSKVAVISNAFILSFTSEFIPYLVYRLVASPDGTLNGYMNYSLSYLDVKDLDNLGSAKLNESIKYCRFKDHRNPPWHPDKYALTIAYWELLAARVIFLVLFENIVIFVVVMISWAIPDIPTSLKLRIQRENYVINNIILEHAKKKGGPKRAR